jgi:hypothetical protein
LPEIVTVVTKKELSRNEAEFRDNNELLDDIRKTVLEAVNTDMPIRKLSFPAVMEKSFKRTEDAEKYLNKLRSLGIDADYLKDEILGSDAHTVVSVSDTINEFISCI